MKTIFILCDALKSLYLTQDNMPFLYSLSGKGYYIKNIIPCAGFCERSEIFSGLDAYDTGNFTAIGYLPENSVVADSSFAIYDAPVWLFGVVTSLMHMVWTKMFGGYLGTSIRYSNTLCYNTFPFPKISDEKKQEIESAAENVLITREYYPEKTLAELYDPDKMPQDLREAHAKLDDIVESCYPGYPFASDEARLECLFKLYEKMTKK